MFSGILISSDELFKMIEEGPSSLAINNSAVYFTGVFISSFVWFREQCTSLVLMVDYKVFFFDNKSINAYDFVRGEKK
jgi:hypothetical protein